MYYIRDMKTLAARLIWAREQKKLTQDGLAKLAGVSQGTIGNLESGLRQTARKIVNIAVAAGVDPIWLSEGKGEPDGKAMPAVTAAPDLIPSEPKMTLAHDDELRLLDLYRRADARGKRTIQRVAIREAGAAEGGNEAEPS